MHSKYCISQSPLIYILLAVIAVFTGCNLGNSESSCPKTSREFIQYFNRQDFRGVAGLFQPNTLNRGRINALEDNLTYIFGVAGAIKGMQFEEQTDNRITYISIHENTAMDVIFRVNEDCQIVSYFMDTHFPDSLPELERNTTSLRLPFDGEWYVEWGGQALDQNYHNAQRNMKGAFDFTIKDENGKHYRDEGKKNQDYYAFGQEITAPCRATVVKVIDGVRDNPIGRPSAQQHYGNAIVLQTEANEFLLLAHLQEKSILVREGQQVDQGDPLARCGNSGYSNTPHLHFIVQNVADLFHPTGANCYFDSIAVNGVLRQDYSPVQGELVRNYLRNSTNFLQQF